MHKKTPFCERRCAKYICRIANNARLGFPDVTPTDDFKIKEIQSFEKYMEMAVLPVVKTDTSIKQLNAWLDQTDSTNP